MIRVTELANGVRVVSEAMPGSRSVTAGFWVGVGARDEAPALAGASHFLEHLLFKGTATRSAASIAETVDAIGGEMNAFTTPEYTAYHARLPEGHLEIALDLLSDVVWAPALRPGDVESERQVILEELLAEEDCPDERVLTLASEALYPDHPLGREVLGDRASITVMGRDDIASFHSRWYRPANVVVAVAGAVDHDDVVAGVERRSTDAEGGTAPIRHQPVQAPEPLRVLCRRTEQAHLAVAVRGLHRDHPDRHALAVANAVLGGGMSSRLFRVIRDERGLAYSVYSFVEHASDTGSLVVYAGTNPARALEVLDLVVEQVDLMVRDGVSEEELERAKGSIEGGTILGLEDSASRMDRIGHALVTSGRVPEVDEALAAVRAVTTDDVAAVATQVLGGQRAVAVVGPVSRAALERRVA